MYYELLLKEFNLGNIGFCFLETSGRLVKSQVSPISISGRFGLLAPDKLSSQVRFEEASLTLDHQAE